MDIKEKLKDILDEFVYDDWYSNSDIAKKTHLQRRNSARVWTLGIVNRLCKCRSLLFSVP